ncbi:hypothetical protein Y1Q_0002944 [Alligator mississippiensis]|uniref:Uncharacterized protein n=1 Tax=Alligator mississippiensis TaxID=8496 RepID=A0A151MCW4_ALLMI|nr:hypothetical protein Y1Q_0002944 [Alligator mississippiensis]
MHTHSIWSSTQQVTSMDASPLHSCSPKTSQQPLTAVEHPNGPQQQPEVLPLESQETDALCETLQNVTDKRTENSCSSHELQPFLSLNSLLFLSLQLDSARWCKVTTENCSDLLLHSP